MANKYRILAGQHRDGKTLYRGPVNGAPGDTIISESDLCGRFRNKFELIEKDVKMPVPEKEPVVEAEETDAAAPAPNKGGRPRKVATPEEHDTSLLTEDDVTDQYPDAVANGYVVFHVDAPHAKGGGYFIRKAGSDENLAGGAKVKLQVAPTLEKLILGDL